MIPWYWTFGISLVVLFPPIIIPLIAVYLTVSFWRLRQKQKAWAAKHPNDKWMIPKYETNTLLTRDGLKIQYYVIRGGPKVILLCCPLGGCRFDIFAPLIHRYEGEYTFITWDYRGLFDSQMPKRLRRISIPEHAQDGSEVLRAAGYDFADITIGHSMGVQVSLELSLLYPEQVGRLVLLNGSHGQVFQGAFMPLARIPLIGDLARSLVNWLIRRSSYLETVRNFMKPWNDLFLPFYVHMFGSKYASDILGPNYFAEFMHGYLGDITRDLQTSTNWLRLFCELDAHSVYHMLPNIQQPTLLISGVWDVFTPAYFSFEMARKIPNSRHYWDGWSSHVTIMENPECIIAELQSFLEETNPHRHKSIALSEEKAQELRDEIVENKENHNRHGNDTPCNASISPHIMESLERRATQNQASPILLKIMQTLNSIPDKQVWDQVHETVKQVVHNSRHQHQQ